MEQLKRDSLMFKKKHLKNKNLYNCKKITFLFSGLIDMTENLGLLLLRYQFLYQLGFFLMQGAKNLSSKRIYKNKLLDTPTFAGRLWNLT